MKWLRRSGYALGVLVLLLFATYHVLDFTITVASRNGSVSRWLSADATPPSPTARRDDAELRPAAAR